MPRLSRHRGGLDCTKKEAAAAFLRQMFGKPVFAFVAGKLAPKEKRMGHAGAIIAGGRGTADEKLRMLAGAGATVIDSPADIGRMVKTALGTRRASAVS